MNEVSMVSAIKGVLPSPIEQLTTNNVGTSNLFNEMINGVKKAEESIDSADVLLERAALDEPVNAHELMITLEVAKSQVRLLVEVRNKLLEGYQEVMRMQV